VSGDFVSVRILAAGVSAPQGELLRQGAAAIPDMFSHVHVANAAQARAALAEGHVDIALIDSTMLEREEVLAAAHSAAKRPALVLVAPTRQAAVDLAAATTADVVAVKPGKVADAKTLIESCARLKVPSRVLVVDDSSTMRILVGKILGNCRFPLVVAEAAEGIDALKQIGAGKFDFVFLDYNMPGLDGFETLAQIRRAHPRLGVVMMTSDKDEALAERARGAGALCFLKKPFYPADVDAILYAFHGLERPRRH
jgi:CheY-like chemotaxis protein